MRTNGRAVLGRADDQAGRLDLALSVEVELDLTVRLAVVQTLLSFLLVPSLPREWVTQSCLRLLVQNLVVEERNDIRRATLEIWKTALSILHEDAARMEKQLLAIVNINP